MSSVAEPITVARNGLESFPNGRAGGEAVAQLLRENTPTWSWLAYPPGPNWFTGPMLNWLPSGVIRIRSFVQTIGIRVRVVTGADDQEPQLEFMSSSASPAK